jgi:sialic acid synthase SpsE
MKITHYSNSFISVASQDECIVCDAWVHQAARQPDGPGHHSHRHRAPPILHCVSGYPAPAADYNLRTIPDMIQRFGLVTGLSDHTLDNTTAITSVAMGASIIEKHTTLDRSGGGPDDSFSLEPAELAALCKDSKTAWAALGKVDYGRKSSEEGNVKFRRSLYFVKDLKVGDVIAADAVRSVRPGFGLAPKNIGQIIGSIVIHDVFKNQPVSRCRVPCDHVPVRSWPLFRARQLMRGVIASLQGEKTS